MQQIDPQLEDNNIYRYLSHGEWKTSTSGRTISITSPIDDSLVGSIQAVTKEEAIRAIQDAAASFPHWSALPMDKRADYLHKAADILHENSEMLTNLLIFEIGKPYDEAKEEVERTVSLIHYYAEEGRRILQETLYSDSFPGYGKTKVAMTERVPLGVILAIPPFNYPINEGAPKIVGALIAGNTIVFKPSTQGAISSLSMVACFHKAGIPAGVLNAITGESDEIGDSIVGHPLIAGINFTGSTQTANHIRDTMQMVPLIAGLSGKDAAIVLTDYPENAIEEIASGAFSYSGQRCTAIKRVLLEESIADSFTQALSTKVNALYMLGDPRDQSISQGPVINMHTVAYLDTLLDDATQKGATIVIGGKSTQENRRMYPCTIIDHVSEDMRIAWEEPFGPLLPIIRVKDIDDAVRIANKSEYGLQSSVFTKNIYQAFDVANKLDVGTVQINGKDTRGPDHFPFLGIKHSGIGQVQGAKYLIESMTRIKTTVINK